MNRHALRVILETVACCLIGAAIGLAFAFSLPG